MWRTSTASACCNRGRRRRADGLAARAGHPAGPARRGADRERPSARPLDRAAYAADCTARTPGSATTTRSRPPSSRSATNSSTGCWRRRSTARSRPSESVAGFSARWTRRLVDAIEVVDRRPAVRSGHVTLGAGPVARGAGAQVRPPSVRARPPGPRLHQRGQARLLATLVEALLAWLADPEEVGPAAPAAARPGRAGRGGAAPVLRIGPPGARPGGRRLRGQR